MTKTVALVTGANKGIGREIARGLARLGITVLAASRDERRGEKAAAELRSEGLDVRSIQLDVTDEKSVALAAQRISEEFGVLDVLVNNAGITHPQQARPSETPPQVMREVYETNVFGVVAVTNAMLPLLRLSAAGRIVNISSGLASLTRNSVPDSPLPMLLAYNSSKSALNAITVLYAKELRETGIKVNACEPGLCDTDLNDYTGERTAAHGSKIAVRMATVDADGPTGTYVSDDGVIPW